MGCAPLAICMGGEIRLSLWDDDSCIKLLNSKLTQAPNVANDSAIYCFEISGSKGICTYLILECEDWANKVFHRRGIVGRKAKGIKHLNRTLLPEHIRDDVDRLLEGSELTKCVITIF